MDRRVMIRNTKTAVAAIVMIALILVGM